MRIVTVGNGKGGTGKTTTAMALAAVATEAGQRVLVVDVDPQASATWWAERIGDTLPFDFATDTDPSILQRLRDVAGYDLVLADTPGNARERDLLAAVIRNSDDVIIPTEPTALAVKPTIDTARQLVDPHGIPCRALFTKVDARAPRDLEDGRALLDGAGIASFNNFIQHFKAHDRAPLNGELITTSRLPNADRAAEDYRKVALELFGNWSRIEQPAVVAEVV